LHITCCSNQTDILFFLKDILTLPSSLAQFMYCFLRTRTLQTQNKKVNKCSNYYTIIYCLVMLLIVFVSTVVKNCKIVVDKFYVLFTVYCDIHIIIQSYCLRQLSSATSRLLRLWVRIPPEALISVCCKRCVFRGRGLFDELITRPEESYRLWYVVVCNLGTS
jgi:hypothetical protein